MFTVRNDAILIDCCLPENYSTSGDVKSEVIPKFDFINIIHFTSTENCKFIPSVTKTKPKISCNNKHYALKSTVFMIFFEYEYENKN